jgi:hypothetical protein
LRIRASAEVLQNAFAKLHKTGLNYYKMLVTDVLHEFELGVWKLIFMHLIRILLALGASVLLSRLDEA